MRPTYKMIPDVPDDMMIFKGTQNCYVMKYPQLNIVLSFMDENIEIIND